MAASVMRQTNSQGTYTFSSQPRAVTQRKKYRTPQEDDAPVFYGNIMFDRRVIRGNTYSQHVFPTTAGVDPVELQKQQLLEARRRREMAAQRRKRQQQQQLRSITPGPVEGRKHIDIQTERYLEELNDRVEEIEAGCQTDEFLDRPPSPLYIPAKTGIDCGTQIESGELFDFNVEVAPVLEVLVGKTMEQALLEVLEEEELADIREQQRQFEELRNAELAECQRLEEQERRHREEKERRMKEQTELLRRQKDTADRIAAHAFAQGYIADLVPAVFGNLERHGYFYDAVERDIERDFLPWLGDEVERRLTTQATARRIVDSLIREVTQSRAHAFQLLHQRELEAQQQKEAGSNEQEVDGEEQGQEELEEHKPEEDSEGVTENKEGEATDDKKRGSNEEEELEEGQDNANDDVAGVRSARSDNIQEEANN